MKSSIIIATLSIGLIGCFNLTVLSQATSGNNGNVPLSTQDYVGWTNGTNASLNIKNEDNRPIIFYNNAGATTFNNPRAIIAAGGNFGIGRMAPTFQLCVRSHITIDTLIVYPTIANGQIGCYMIGSQTVLHNNGTRNIFTGVGTGIALTTGTDNVFNGFNAGTANTIGAQNTFIGAEAGNANTSGSTNTFIGMRSGFLNSTGTNNAFIGRFSGLNNTTGQSNVFMGASAGVNSTFGSFNVYLGSLAGQTNVRGDSNVLVGDRAGSL